MRISDWSSDVCSSDLLLIEQRRLDRGALAFQGRGQCRAIEVVAERFRPQRPQQRMRLQRLAADQVHDAEASGLVETDLRALVGHEDYVIVTIERRAFALGTTLDDHHASGHAGVAKKNNGKSNVG